MLPEPVEHPIHLLPERTFGLLIAGLLGVVACWPLLGAGDVRWWAAGPAGVMALAALAAPGWLAPLNRGWSRVGRFVQELVNTIVLAILFYVVFTSFGLVMRALGKRPLELSFDPAAVSYWKKREPPGPDPASMKLPF